MSKMFDIGPPKPIPKKQKNTTRSTNTTKRKKPQSSFLVVIFIICIFVLLFSLSNNTSSQYTQADTDSIVNNLTTKDISAKPSDNPLTKPSKTENVIEQKQANQEEILNNNSSSDIQVVVMNGARISGVANEVKETLENNNIPVSEVGNTENLYTKTTIYYTDDNLKLTEKIKETLSDYNPISEINLDFASSQKILIIIGDNE